MLRATYPASGLLFDELFGEEGVVAAVAKSPVFADAVTAELISDSSRNKAVKGTAVVITSFACPPPLVVSTNTIIIIIIIQLTLDS